MSAQIDRDQLRALLAAHRLEGALGSASGVESTVGRLDAFFECYQKHRSRHGSASSQPAEQDFAALLLQSAANPHRVQVLLQALAFVCSPEMLAMLWMVELGANVKTLHVDHQRENVTRLKVLLDLAGEAESTEEFESTEHWDLALLQFASLTRSTSNPSSAALSG